MELALHRLVFRVDFINCFRFLDVRGEILAKQEAMPEKSGWDRFNIRKDGTLISMERKRDSERVLLNVEIDSVNGVVEKHPLGDLDDYRFLVEAINDTVGQVLKPREFRRLGTRFFFLSPGDSFEQGKGKVAECLDSGFETSLRATISDLALSLVLEKADAKINVTFGPVSREECKKKGIFELEDVSFEHGILYDCDYFVQKYEFRTFQFDKFVANALHDVRLTVADLSNYIKKGRLLQVN